MIFQIYDIIMTLTFDQKKKGYKYGEGFPSDRTVQKSIHLITALKKTQRKRKTHS